MSKHRLAHLLGLNYGRVTSFVLDGYIWVGFRCSTCDEINGAHKVCHAVSNAVFDRSDTEHTVGLHPNNDYSTDRLPFI